MDLYQSLVSVNPVTLIAQIANLFLQLFIGKVFFLDKVRNVLDRRQEAVDRELSEARSARDEAQALRGACEESLRDSRAQADALLRSARDSAALRGEEILQTARSSAARLRQTAEADIARQKAQALREARGEISGLALAIAGKVLDRELDTAGRRKLVDSFLSQLGDDP